MLIQALLPWAIGRSIDEVVAADPSSAWWWAAVIAMLGVAQAIVGLVRQRAAVSNWLHAMFRSMQVISRHTARGGPPTAESMATGEVIATATSDARQLGHFLNAVPRFLAAFLAYLAVSVIILNTSVLLGLIVLIAVPVLGLALMPIMAPLHRRQQVLRDELGGLTSLSVDTVIGLRILRGIGGERVFTSRYKQRSESVRSAGVGLARTLSTLESAQLLLPGVFIVAFTWIGAWLAADGHISPGTLVALYGYALFLAMPVRITGEIVASTTRAVVGARRVITVLGTSREVPDDRTAGTANTGAEPSSGPLPLGRELADASADLRIPPHEFTVLAAARLGDATDVADRLGRLKPANGVTYDGLPLERVPLAQVRERIVVSGAEPFLFTGTLRDAVDPRRQHTDERLLTVLEDAAATDVLQSLPDGLDGQIDERARSLSGGQRQRLALARALLIDPEVLILVEPTSAVDAHTEATIARNLRRVRAGRTTVVVSRSPLMAVQADSVMWLTDGRVTAVGSHTELLGRNAAYRRAVNRTEDMT